MNDHTRESLEFLVRLMQHAQQSKSIDPAVVSSWIQRIQAALDGREIMESTW